jgi:hypothetical protein
MKTSIARAAALALAAAALLAARARGQEPPAARPVPDPSTAASTATPDAEAAERKVLEEQIRRELGQPSTDPRAPDAGAAAQGAAPGAAQGGNPLARVMLLPDISALANASLTWDDATEEPRFTFEELELALQAVVDPYVRADVFIAFSDEGAEIEEAFITTLGLPLGFQIRAGKLFAPFGRLNQQHPHVREFVTPPLAQRLVAEESLGGPGVAVSWLTPLPWFAELHLAAHQTAPLEPSVVDGLELAETEDDGFTGVARLLQYLPVGETTTIGVGLSAARRDEGRTAFQAPGPRSQYRDMAGADVYLRVRPATSRSYLTVSGEVYARRFKGVEGVSDDFDTGWWTQAFAKVGRHFGAGARYERAPSPSVDGEDERVGALVGWFPSEFQRIRLELSRESVAAGDDVFTALLNVEFGIGAHGAHPF